MQGFSKRVRYSLYRHKHATGLELKAQVQRSAILTRGSETAYASPNICCCSWYSPFRWTFNYAYSVVSPLQVLEAVLAAERVNTALMRCGLSATRQEVFSETELPLWCLLASLPM